MDKTNIAVAAYVRVSTDKQASDEHFSIPEQTDRIKAYCAAKRWNLVKIYTDPGYSGKDLNRPAIQQLITECKRYDLVLVNKLDRLSRSQKDTLYLIEDVFMKNGVQFASMTENFDTSTPLGMAMVGILSTFAQLERSQIKERMMTGQEGRAKKGLFHGSDKVPIGYKYIEGHLIVDEEEADMVREVYSIFLSGMSIRQISRHMKETYPESRIEWTWNTVSRMVQNPTYIGKTVYRDMTFDGDHQAIIDNDTFERAQTAYSLLDHSNPQWRNPSHKLLSGFIWCGECGSRYGITYSHSIANGHRYCYEYYQCYARRYKDESGHRCNSKNYRMTWLDEQIKQKILTLNLDDIKEGKKEAADHSKEIARLEK